MTGVSAVYQITVGNFQNVDDFCEEIFINFRGRSLGRSDLYWENLQDRGLEREASTR